jgi:thymidylate synthase (FAD)
MQVLDHGYLKIIETWGSDERIVEAARMSTAKGFLGWGNGEKPGDEKLLRYLYENAHHTPFEMAGAIVEVQAPIFVFREWHRHRTQSYNELSARYTPLPDLNYVPSVERMLLGGGATKQAGMATGADTLTATVAESLIAEEERFNEAAERFYQEKLARGVPKELARTHLGVSRYSRMRASANLRNWLTFLTLRSEKNPKAQWEIRQYGRTLADALRPVFPRTFSLFEEKGSAS